MELQSTHNNTRAKVSVIVPIYGVERYIEQCAISLFEQILDDVEYIFVNDCTKDRSIEILRAVAERYPNRKSRIRVIDMEQNSGQAAVRKRGIEAATGEFIIHCDSDDTIERDMLYKLYTTATNEECDVVICDFNIVKGESCCHREQSIPREQMELLRDILRERVHGSLCNKLVSKNLYDKILYFPKDNLLEDFTIVVQLIANSRKHAHINEALYNYYQHPESITNSQDSSTMVNRALQSLNNTKLILKYLDKMALTQRFHTEIVRLKYTMKTRMRHICLCSGGFDEWRRIFPELKPLKVLSTELSRSNKIVYLITCMGLYPLFIKIKRTMQQR